MAEEPRNLLEDVDDIFGAPPPQQPPPSSPPAVVGSEPVTGQQQHSDLFDDVADEIDLGTGSGTAEPPKMGTLTLDSDSDEEKGPPPSASPVTNGTSSPDKPLPSLTPAAAAASPRAPPASQVPASVLPPSPQSPVQAPPPIVAPSSPSSKPLPVSKPSQEEASVFEPARVGLEISVSEFEKRGEGMNSYVVFKVVTKVDNVGGFRKSEYVVMRRFSDFLGLHEKLVVKHVRAGRIVPPPPEKSVVGMTKTKWAGQEEDASATEFLERRKAALERFLRRVVQHPALITDPDLRDFLTMESDLPKATGTAALSGQGVKRMFKGVGEAFSKMAYRMEETDRWFEEKTNEVEELDESLRKLQTSVEGLVSFRRELASSTDAFCKAMSMLAACEENTALSRAFSQLAETQEKVGLCQQQQADKDFYILSETLKDYVALIGSVKEVLYERVKVWSRWQAASSDLTKKRELKTRLELAGKSDKLPQAKADVAAAEAKVGECEEEFGRISDQIRKEMVRFDGQRVLDFKATLLQYLDSLALTQNQLVKHWETFLPEARAIIS